MRAPRVERLTVAGAGREPEVLLLDARETGGVESDLREAARDLAVVPDGAQVTRSYSFPYALVAWHAGAVGVDIERIDDCEPGFADVICTPAEYERFAGASDGELTALWSSKEALAKALGDALEYDPSRLDSPLTWPAGSAGPWRAERLPVAPGYVGWVCWRAD